MYHPENIKILVVDDEDGILDFLELGLQEEGFQVVTAQNGQAALQVAENFRPQIVILDIMMPEMDGFEVCSALKEMGNFAVIMLTARDEVADRVRGLSIGADDYVVKPFSFQELLARIYARLRNQFPYLLNEFQVGPFRIEDARKEISFQNKELSLTVTEYELLKYLLINHRIVLSKSRILDAIWGYDFGGQENIVEVYIRALREKLGDKEHELIKTIRGAGYLIDL